MNASFLDGADYGWIGVNNVLRLELIKPQNINNFEYIFPIENI
jgi:hypothetical protein